MHFNDMTELVACAKDCRRCALCEVRTNVVCGQGDPNARVMFIGEGPGQNEDLQGLPFVGAAGKFLDELIAVMGYKRQDVYIANVLKCRPPQNRDPLPEELLACRDYIDEQVRLIDPSIIVTLGRFSMAMFFDNASISKIHGIPKRVGKTVYYPMYHPAVALYNGSMRSVLIGDARKVPLILKKLDKMQTDGLLYEETSVEPEELISSENSLHNNEVSSIIEKEQSNNINRTSNRQLSLF